MILTTAGLSPLSDGDFEMLNGPFVSRLESTVTLVSARDTSSR
jgi:hypothetical protein